MNNPLPPLLIEADLDPNTAVAGSSFPVLVRLKAPADLDDVIRVRNIESQDPDIQIDSDLLQRDVEIRPGETYCFTILLRVPRVKDVTLSSIHVELAGANVHQVFPISHESVGIRPSLASEVAVRDQPICSYGEVTKVQLSLKHKGETHYDNLLVTIGPPERLLAGKQPLKRSTFGPNDEEVVQVAADGDLELTLKARVNGAEVTAVKSVRVRPVQPRSGSLFRFLEPRRLAEAAVSIHTLDGAAAPLLRLTRVLAGGTTYRVQIRPQATDVTEITLLGIPGKVHVRKEAFDRDDNTWKFEIDVPYSELWSQPERLIYRGESGSGPFTGEVHVTLVPPRLRHLHFAIILGLTATAQGVAALARRILAPDASVTELFSSFSFERDLHLLFLLLIPLAWGAVRATDWVQSRLRA